MAVPADDPLADGLEAFPQGYLAAARRRRERPRHGKGVERSAACVAPDRDAFQHEKGGSLSTFPTHGPGWMGCIPNTSGRWGILIYRLEHWAEHYGV